jgi:hypothetical protein
MSRNCSMCVRSCRDCADETSACRGLSAVGAIVFSPACNAGRAPPSSTSPGGAIESLPNTNHRPALQPTIKTQPFLARSPTTIRSATGAADPKTVRTFADCHSSRISPVTSDPSQMIDHTRDAAGAEAVIDIHHAHIRRATIQHRQQRRHPSETRPVARAGRHCDHRSCHHPRHHTR